MRARRSIARAALNCARASLCRGVEWSVTGGVWRVRVSGMQVLGRVTVLCTVCARAALRARGEGRVRRLGVPHTQRTNKQYRAGSRIIRVGAPEVAKDQKCCRGAQRDYIHVSRYG